MIVEVRSYRIKPGHREDFIRLFESRAIPALRDYGMKVVGPMLDVENPNKFVFLRSFSLTCRARSIERRVLHERFMKERTRRISDAAARQLRRHPLRDFAGMRV